MSYGAALRFFPSSARIHSPLKTWLAQSCLATAQLGETEVGATEVLGYEASITDLRWPAPGLS